LLLGRVVGQSEGSLIGGVRTLMITQRSQQLGPRRVQEVVLAQSVGHLLNLCQRCIGAVKMAERDGLVESDYR
jgi:hypothetical protein